MSHYVTITRNPSPYWESGEHIAEAEWRAVPLSDPEFRPETDAELAEPGRTKSRSVDLVWTAHPQHPKVWFSWYKGQIDVRNPDDFTLGKMAALATSLSANVIGEQGERFDASGKSLGVHDLPEEPGTRKPSWLRRLFGGT